MVRSERNTLKQTAKKSESEMRRMQDQMLKRKINLEHKMFVDAKDGESKKSKIMRLRTRVKG